jgi:hypothetical protein
MDKYNTLEYFQVKAITIFVRLRNFLCALYNTNKIFGTVARETIGVKILIMILMSTNVVYQ